MVQRWQLWGKAKEKTALRCSAIEWPRHIWEQTCDFQCAMWYLFTEMKDVSWMLRDHLSSLGQSCLPQCSASSSVSVCDCSCVLLNLIFKKNTWLMVQAMCLLLSLWFSSFMFSILLHNHHSIVSLWSMRFQLSISQIKIYGKNRGLFSISRKLLYRKCLLFTIDSKEWFSCLVLLIEYEFFHFM